MLFCSFIYCFVVASSVLQLHLRCFVGLSIVLVTGITYVIYFQVSHYFECRLAFCLDNWLLVMLSRTKEA